MAGQKAARRAAFFAQHPRCCFCAGDAQAVEEDHQPGRVFFRDRQWPEGFVFPACERCNRASRDAEQAVSILATDSSTDTGRAAFRTRVASIRQNRPGFIDSLLMSRREKRAAMTELNIHLKPGLFIDDVPMIKMNVKTWQPEIDLFGRKLMLALHYQCFGEPLSHSGAIWLHFSTNAHLSQSREGLEAMLEVAGRFVTPMRSRQPLQDQFAVRWNALDEPRMGVFVVHLHNVVVLSAITCEDPEYIREPHDKFLKPFRWADPTRSEAQTL